MAIMSTVSYINRLIRCVTLPAAFAISLLPPLPIYFRDLDKKDSDALVQIHMDLQQGLYDVYEEKRRIRSALEKMLVKAESVSVGPPDDYVPKTIGKTNDGYAQRITNKGKYR